jgi:hypothetical protein
MALTLCDMSAGLYFVLKNVSFTFIIHLSAILVYDDKMYSVPLMTL